MNTCKSSINKVIGVTNNRWIDDKIIYFIVCLCNNIVILKDYFPRHIVITLDWINHLPDTNLDTQNVYKVQNWFTSKSSGYLTSIINYYNHKIPEKNILPLRLKHNWVYIISKYSENIKH